MVKLRPFGVKMGERKVKSGPWASIQLVKGGRKAKWRLLALWLGLGSGLDVGQRAHSPESLAVLAPRFLLSGVVDARGQAGRNAGRKAGRAGAAAQVTTSDEKALEKALFIVILWL